jgi:hypothetical protein
MEPAMAVNDRKISENGKGEKLPDAVVEQTHRINALRQAIADISGCFDGSKHVWITLLLCRYLVNRLRKYHIATKDIAAWGWVVYQTICALYLLDHPDISDEGCANRVAEAVEKLFEDGADTTALRAQLYRPREQNWLPHQEFLGIRKWAHQSVVGRYPELPAPSILSQLAAVKCLDDVYHYGIYGDIWKTLQLGDSEELVPICYRLPKTVVLELRLLQLFSRGRPEEMVSVCIMHCWETLGRRILDACGNSSTVSEAYDHILQTLEKTDG